MDFIGTQKKVGDSKKTRTVAFTKITQASKAKATSIAELVRQKAISLGIQPGQMNKVELIHSIQRAEGNTACFGTSNSQCPYTDCCFMADCLKV
jgi:hypothetical protein